MLPGMRQRLFRRLRWVVLMGVPLFLVAHTVLAGRWWLWEVFSAIPPRVFLLAPLMLLLMVCLWRRTIVVAMFLLSLALAWPNADVQLPGAPVSAGSEEIAVFSFNTEFWENKPDELLRMIGQEDADLLLLQEHVLYPDMAVHDESELERVLPGRSIAQHSDLLTLTRFPIVATMRGEAFLRTDVRIGERIVRVYNVHLTSPVLPHLVSRPRGFLRSLHSRFLMRQRQLAELMADARGGTGSLIMAGDFNTTKSMRMLHREIGALHDAIGASKEIFPATWEMDQLPAWRIDYVLMSPDMRPVRYERLPLTQFSDHAGLRVGLAW